MDEHASFGYWLRRRRKALDLTQAELAQRVGCAENTIRRIEADERRPSKQLAALLAEQLAIPEAQRAVFLQAARAELGVDRLTIPPPPAASLSDRPAHVAEELQPPAPAAALPTGTVTFLFTDIEGSTKLWEQYPQAMPDALAQHDAVLRAAIAGQGGVVFRTEGDAFCAAFARATDALAAAVAAQRALHTAAWGATGPLRVRMALHTGVVALGGDDYQGLPLSRVARLLAAGHGGQILLSRATQELVREELPPEVTLRDLGEHRLKDLTQSEQIAQLIVPDLPADFPPLKTLTLQRTNLPVQPTPLIGRAQDVAAVRDRVRRADVRLMTLSGPGGVGKTRLALQSAAELLDAFTDGVWFVNLAPISDPNLVASAIAQTLGIKETGSHPLLESLKANLRDKQQLLLLDNFEQVVEAAPLVAELFTCAPHLKVLVTSRTVLHLAGEHEYIVPPLSLPDPVHMPPLEGLTQYDAVRLFIERAQAVKPDFAVTNANAPAVAEICARLDGLPLAIELAAVRLKLFAPEALLKRLEQRLPVLTGGPRDLPSRQQTLRSAIDWSYALLDPGGQALSRRVGVFVSGCTLEAAAAVCAGAEPKMEERPSILDPPSSILDGLAALVDQSLLRQTEQPDGEPRFGMLETLREYALERLNASDEADTIRQQHAHFFLSLAEQTEHELVGPNQATWLERLELEHDNLRAALAWSRERGMAEVGLRLAGTLWWFWLTRGYVSEGRAWLESLLALPARGIPPAMRARALNAAGPLVSYQGDHAQAKVLLEESLALFRELGDTRGTAMALFNLGMSAHNQAQFEQAAALYEQSLAVFRTLSDQRRSAMALNQLGDVALCQGDLARAKRLFEESLALSRALGDTGGIADSLAYLGMVAYRQSDFGRAMTLYEQSMALFRDLGDKASIAMMLRSMGIVARYQGDQARAKELLEQSLAL